MKKMTVIERLLSALRPKKNDIITEAENIINNYIDDEESYCGPHYKLKKVSLALNGAIVGLSVVLAFLMYRLLN